MNISGNSMEQANLKKKQHVDNINGATTTSLHPPPRGRPDNALHISDWIDAPLPHDGRIQEGMIGAVVPEEEFVQWDEEAWNEATAWDDQTEEDLPVEGVRKAREEKLTEAGFSAVKVEAVRKRKELHQLRLLPR